MIYEEGDTLLIEEGVYDCYEIIGCYTVLKKFTLEELQARFNGKGLKYRLYFDVTDCTLSCDVREVLCEEGYLAKIERIKTIHVGSFGKLDITGGCFNDV